MKKQVKHLPVLRASLGDDGLTKSKKRKKK